MTVRFTRRTFLQAGLLQTAGAVSLGVAWQFRSKDESGSQQGAKLLIVSSSMTGSTGAQAGTIAQAAQSRGWQTSLFTAEDAPSPDGYDAVILGSGERDSDREPRVKAYAQRYKEILATMPVGLFQCSMGCAGMLQDEPTGDPQRDKLREDVADLLASTGSLRPTPYA